jgi:hypothetical protein
MDDLGEFDRAILDFERSWWKSPGPKAEAIRARLHMSSTRYYRRLGELVELPSALVYDPLTVKRIRRSRAGRRRARFESRWADPRSSR